MSALGDVSVVPERTTDPAAVLGLIARDGAAILTGVDPTPAGGVEAARAVLGARAVEVRPQFEASKALAERNLQRRSELAEDDLRRTRRHYDHTVPLPPHNDGFAFGDQAPDHLFLNCLRPCPVGGESWLLDGLALVEALSEGPEGSWAATALWDLEVDHTDPGYTTVVGPIARRLTSGRVQVRMNPYQRATGADPAQVALIELWDAAKAEAAASARRFRLDRGELLCADNLRYAHSRDPYVTDDRAMVSTWGWSDEAIDVPSRALELI
jgi:gamma-butyrobetaine dioxygenase